MIARGRPPGEVQWARADAVQFDRGAEWWR